MEHGATGGSDRPVLPDADGAVGRGEATKGTGDRPLISAAPPCQPQRKVVRLPAGTVVQYQAKPSFAEEAVEKLLNGFIGLSMFCGALLLLVAFCVTVVAIAGGLLSWGTRR